MSRIYLSPPDVGDAERSLLLDAFDSNWIAPLGPHVDAFEREFAEAVEVPFALALSSGTGALHLALLALGVQPGDVVITSTLTFAATANAIRYVGAKPVFVDVDPNTWAMSPALLAEAADAQTKAGASIGAVISVDLYGQPCDYDAVQAYCARYDVALISDAAEALGARYRQRPVGSQGCCAAFSFNGNKIITTSGGGMLVSKDEAIISRARHLASQARDQAIHYQHSETGYNYRLSNLLAAVGRGQLRSLQNKIQARRLVNERYRTALADQEAITFMPVANYGTPNYWLTCILINPEVGNGTTREDVRLALEYADIEARPVWKPMHLQPSFTDCLFYGPGTSDNLFDRGLCLPSGSSLSAGDQQRVIDVIVRVLEHA